MASGEPSRPSDPLVATRERNARAEPPTAGSGPERPILETTVSPFHCLYQDALWIHGQSHRRRAQSEAEASRLARASFLLYLQAAEALAHQAAVELGRPELIGTLADPNRPIPLAEAWRLLPAVAGLGVYPAFDPEAPPWPAFRELLALRDAWIYPGPPEARRAYYEPSPDLQSFEPLHPRRSPSSAAIDTNRLILPRTGLPRDPYALRPEHLDTARGVVDQAVSDLDRRLDGALTRDNRHRREPVRFLEPRAGGDSD